MTLHSDEIRWPIGHLPFIWNPLRTPANPPGLPNTLPFTLGLDRRTGSLVQESNPQVSKALAQAYALGSMITGQMDETGIGRRYADDFLEFIGAAGDAPRFQGQRVLEVGCGNGYLLHRVAQLGATVLGLEPGEHGQAKFDVPVIRDFFPSPQMAGRFHKILLFGVLEHVEQPIEFLEQILALLHPGGEALLGVPDCAPYIQAGDLSCLIHEHWSYFDEGSLRRALEQAGGAPIHVCPSGFGGLLYARVTRPESVGADRSSAGSTDGVHEYESRLDHFRERAERGVRAIAAYINAVTSTGETVGVYVPGRIINALFAGGVVGRAIRFFDDNPMLAGTYFPGVDRPVESRAALIDDPTPHVLIMSRSFGDTIAAELRSLLPETTVIRTWHDLFEG